MDATSAATYGARMTTTERNKQLMEEAFAELAQGNRGPFRDLLADDVTWTLIGSTPWSGSYAGRRAVLEELFGPLFEQFADRYTNSPVRILGDGDHVVVECRGRVTTRAGRRYDNTYCYVCRMRDGQVRELTEYCDTELIATALDPPARAPRAA